MFDVCIIKLQRTLYVDLRIFVMIFSSLVTL